MLKVISLTLTLALLPMPVLAADPCEPYPDIPVNITAVFQDPAYNLDTGIPGIISLLNDTKHSIHEQHTTLPLGVTHYEPTLEFRMPVTTVSAPDELACARVDRADVTIGYRNVTVYVAREVFQRTCGFDEIMNHEQKHIAVNRQVLEEYTPIIQEKLKDYLRQHGVFREENVDYAVLLIHQRLQEILTEISTQMYEDNRARQQKVDSPEEYHRLSVSCNGQLMGIADAYWKNHR